MKAASVSGRAKTQARKIAQQMVISHISNYLASIRWGGKLIDCEKYYCLPIPTHRDYLNLLADLEINELSTVRERPSNEFFLVPVPNIYYEEIDRKMHALMRPEDMDKKNVPKLAYLVVRDDFLENEKNKRFKSRSDFDKFLQEVRAIALPILEEARITSLIKSEKRNNKTQREYLRDTGYTPKKIDAILRHNKSQGSKATRPSPELTPRRYIRKEFYPNDRKKFDKIFERLRKMGLWL